MNRKVIIMTVDSVVTVENNKTHQCVDKLFMLSYHPSRGIMIFDFADLLNIFLETIIKYINEKLILKNLMILKH